MPALESFYRLNEDEMLNFSEGNFENLENFYKSRETILNMVQSMDRQIEDLNMHLDPVAPVDSASKKGVINALNYKNEIVTRILLSGSTDPVVHRNCQVRHHQRIVAGSSFPQSARRLSKWQLDEKVERRVLKNWSFGHFKNLTVIVWCSQSTVYDATPLTI